MIRQLRFAMFALASFLATPSIQAQVVYKNESIPPSGNHSISTIAKASKRKTTGSRIASWSYPAARDSSRSRSCSVPP